MKIKSIIQGNGSRLDKACMIGDTVSDIEQGQIAGGRRDDSAGARTCPSRTPRRTALADASRRLTKIRATSAVSRRGTGSPSIRAPSAQPVKTPPRYRTSTRIRSIRPPKYSLRLSVNSEPADKLPEKPYSAKSTNPDTEANRAILNLSERKHPRNVG